DLDELFLRPARADVRHERTELIPVDALVLALQECEGMTDAPRELLAGELAAIRSLEERIERPTGDLTHVGILAPPAHHEGAGGHASRSREHRDVVARAKLALALGDRHHERQVAAREAGRPRERVDALRVRQPDVRLDQLAEPDRRLVRREE